jgi:predicted acylesterase/phospholipase RssA
MHFRNPSQICVQINFLLKILQQKLHVPLLLKITTYLRALTASPAFQFAQTPDHQVHKSDWFRKSLVSGCFLKNLPVAYLDSEIKRDVIAFNTNSTTQEHPCYFCENQDYVTQQQQQSTRLIFQSWSHIKFASENFLAARQLLKLQRLTLSSQTYLERDCGSVLFRQS